MLSQPKMIEPFFYTRPQIDKLGNAIIYLATQIPNLNKTKLLKLIYLLEEISLKKYGFPFFNIRFDVWKFGPVSKDVFVELSDTPDLLDRFIRIEKAEDATLIRPKMPFDDDEFSDNDLALLEYVTTTFRHATAKQLVDYTHRKHAPWYQTALRYGLHQPFALGQLNSTNIEIDFSYLFEDEKSKLFYLENKELLAFREHLK
jgi:uncharacterized phage-associated protein